MSQVHMGVKGMPDLLPWQMPYWHHLEKTLFSILKSYGFSEIRLPILEKTALFHRSIGEHSEIVSKEMFSFEDQNKTFLSLRPEGTASLVRAVNEHYLLRHHPQMRLWYIGPMFRRERPQKGRYRQFWQIGVESLGISNLDATIEHIEIMANLLNQLDLSSHVQLEINTLGLSEDRNAYRNKLVEYLQSNFDKLDEESKLRLKKNPLRILDSKNQVMQPLIKNSPIMYEAVDQKSKKEFEELTYALKARKIKFKVNPHLVRGLDYYQGIVYEWTTSKLGAQSAIAAGGSYDNLLAQLGGQKQPASGFAMGLERVILLLQEVHGKNHLQYANIFVGTTSGTLDKNLGEIVFVLRKKIKDSGLSIWTHYGLISMKNLIKKAYKNHIPFVLAIQDDAWILKNLKNGQQGECNMYNLLETFSSLKS